MNIYSRTWNRDSHGLYDYENNSVKEWEYIIDKSGIVTRKKSELKFVDQSNFEINSMENEEQVLIKIVKNESKRYYYSDRIFISNPILNNLSISNDNLTSLQDKIWNVIKSNNLNNNTNIINNSRFLSNFQYCLRKNDIIKLGRIKFLINIKLQIPK